MWQKVGGRMTTQITERQYDDGPGAEVIFYEYGTEIGKAHTVEYNGKSNAFLHNLYVKEEFRGKGYGTQILRYMIENYDVDALYVNRDNKSIRLYKRFGFEEIDAFDNMIVMQRKGCY